MKKRCLSLLLCLLMVLTLLPTAVFAAKFSDVKAGAYYEKPVEWAVEKGITAGKSDGTFAPDETCSRAHILTFLWRAAGCPQSEVFAVSNPFQDVKDDAYYCEAAKWALEEQIFTEAYYFKPGTPCTRAATVEFFWRAAGSPYAETVPFSDIPSGTELEQAVSWAIHAGVTNGTTATTFSPNNTVTRAQIVTFLYRQYVAPLDNSALIEASKPAPQKPVPAPGIADLPDMDPLPPKKLSQQPDWYQSLTKPENMSNARLVAEFNRYHAISEEYRSLNLLGNALLIRGNDLSRELSHRIRVLEQYNWYPNDSDAVAAYNALVEKYGDPQPIYDGLSS